MARNRALALKRAKVRVQRRESAFAAKMREWSQPKSFTLTSEQVEALVARFYKDNAR